MRLMYVDCETGGLYASSHALLSIGVVALEMEEGKQPAILDQFAARVRPHERMGVTAKALEVQGIGWADLDDPARVEEAEALWMLEGFFTKHFGTFDATCAPSNMWPFFAHNAPFDRDFLSAAVRRMEPSPRGRDTHVRLRDPKGRTYEGKVQQKTNHSGFAPRSYTDLMCQREARWVCTRYLAESLIAFGCMELPQGGVLESGQIIKPGVALDALALHLKLEPRTGGHQAMDDAKLGARVLVGLWRRTGWY